MTASEPTPNHPKSISLQQRIDAICNRFEAAWSAQQPPRIEEYLAEVPESSRASLLRELLRVDLELASRSRQLFSEDPYLRQCRQYADVIREVFKERPQSADSPKAGASGAHGGSQASIASIQREIDRGQTAMPEGRRSQDTNQEPGPNHRDDDASLAESIRTLGDYQIIREIGRGGMGVVYEAQQISLNRRVALKILPTSAVLDRRQLQRFKNEAQAAALLHHPNIVPIFGVGSDRGVHFFAMHFVEGPTLADVIRELQSRSPGVAAAADRSGDRVPKPIARRPGDGQAHDIQKQTSRGTDSSTSPALARLSTERSSSSPAYFRSAAKLGIQVADALQHAHEQGILHRDIKPSNLLFDERGNVWVTDFGLAQIWGDSDLTMTGDLIGTLRYMSPEQALAKRVPIDHRTDIYSLGVTLYELFTLEPAFRGNDRQEILQQIAFEDPRPPRRINKKFPVELETIVLKATAKNPVSRYDSAADLAEDLRSFLEDKPIKARRPTIAERAFLWSRRHRTVVAAALLLLVTVTIGSSVAAINIAAARNEAERNAASAEEARNAARDAQATAQIEAARANRKAETAEAVADFLQGMFRGTEFFGHGGVGFGTGLQRSDVTAEGLLDLGARMIEDQLGDDPLIKAKLMAMIGSSYLNLGFAQKAAPLLEGSLQIRQKQFRDPHLDLADSLRHVGLLRFEQGYIDEAEPLLRSGLQMRRELLGEEHLEVALDKFFLAWLLSPRRETLEAVQLFTEVLRLRRRQLGEKNRQVAYAVGGLVLAYWNRNRMDEAMQLLTDAADTFAHLDADVNPLEPLMSLTFVIVNLTVGNDEGAIQGAYDTIEKARRVYGERHAVTLAFQYVIAVNAVQIDLDAAADLMRGAVATVRESVGDHPRTAELCGSFAAVLAEQAKYEQAEEFYRQAIAIRRTRQGRQHPLVATDLVALGSLRRAAGKYEEAEKLLLNALEILREHLGNNHRSVASALNHLARVSQDQGQYERAEELLRQALAIHHTRLGDEVDSGLAATLFYLARVLHDKDDHEKAEELCRRSLEIDLGRFGKMDPEAPTDLAACRSLLPDAYQPEQARVDSQAVIELRIGRYNEEHRQLAETLQELALVLRDKGEYPEAEQMINYVLEVRRKRLGEEHPSIAASLSELGSLLCAMGEFEMAEKELAHALGILRESLPSGDWRVADVESRLGGCLAALERYAEAEPKLLKSYATIKARFFPEHKLALAALTRLVELYNASGNQGKSAQYRTLLQQASEQGGGNASARNRD